MNTGAQTQHSSIRNSDWLRRTWDEPGRFDLRRCKVSEMQPWQLEVVHHHFADAHVHDSYVYDLWLGGTNCQRYLAKTP